VAKITKTYSIDQKIYEAFEQVADEKSINKSSFIEGCINKYLNDNNRHGVDKVYVLKTDPSYGVTIKKQDDTFYYLNDGSKIPIILFMQMYKEVEQVNPNEFFNNTLADRLTVRIDGQNQSLSKTGYEDAEKINS
jgi:hypothetical protein